MVTIARRLLVTHYVAAVLRFVCTAATATAATATATAALQQQRQSCVASRRARWIDGWMVEMCDTAVGMEWYHGTYHSRWSQKLDMDMDMDLLMLMLMLLTCLSVEC